jgi:hypothetical protein
MAMARVAGVTCGVVCECLMLFGGGEVSLRVFVVQFSGRSAVSWNRYKKRLKETG